MRELTEGVCGCEEITRIELATDCARNLGYFSNTSVTEYNQTPPIPQQLGAGVARGAHNPEVTGSKPVVAIILFSCCTELPHPEHCRAFAVCDHIMHECCMQN